MSDVGLILDDENNFDLALEAGDIKTDAGLQTAVSISLFSDRRIEVDELPLGEDSRRGWWGDEFGDEPGDKIGSRLWLLAREKRTVDVANRAEEYALEALQWMVDDGVVTAIDADADYDDQGQLILIILISRPNGNLTFRFKIKWDAEANRER